MNAYRHTIFGHLSDHEAASVNLMPKASVCVSDRGCTFSAVNFNSKIRLPSNTASPTVKRHVFRTRRQVPFMPLHLQRGHHHQRSRPVHVDWTNAGLAEFESSLQCVNDRWFSAEGGCPIMVHPRRQAPQHELSTVHRNRWRAVTIAIRLDRGAVHPHQSRHFNRIEVNTR